MKSVEYELTVDDPNTESLLRDRMRHSVRISLPTFPMPEMMTVSKEQQRANFVINEVSIGTCERKGDMDRMRFLVSFVSPNGSVEPSVWVNGQVFNSLITHHLKKKKYVLIALYTLKQDGNPLIASLAMTGWDHHKKGKCSHAG